MNILKIWQEEYLLTKTKLQIEGKCYKTLLLCWLLYNDLLFISLLTVTYAAQKCKWNTVLCFHGNTGYMNESQYYIICTLPNIVCFMVVKLHGMSPAMAGDTLACKRIACKCLEANGNRFSQK